MISKKILIISIAVVVIFGVYSAFASQTQKKEINMSDKKILIAYYSHSGNTKAVAQKIQSVTGGDLFEIQPKKAYSTDYNTVVNQAKDEKAKDVKPELVDNGNVKDYDVIFVGTPVWWYTMASPVKTFLSANNFDGKTIVPFCTHGGGGASSTYTDMKKLAPNAKFDSEFTSYNNSASSADVEKWLKDLKF